MESLQRMSNNMIIKFYAILEGINLTDLLSYLKVSHSVLFNSFTFIICLVFLDFEKLFKILLII